MEVIYAHPLFSFNGLAHKPNSGFMPDFFQLFHLSCQILILAPHCLLIPFLFLQMSLDIPTVILMPQPTCLLAVSSTKQDIGTYLLGLLCCSKFLSSTRYIQISLIHVDNTFICFPLPSSLFNSYLCTFASQNT